MKTLSFLLVLATLAPAATGDFLFQKKTSSGYAPVLLTPENGKVIAWSGGAPVNVSAGSDLTAGPVRSTGSTSSIAADQITATMLAGDIPVAKISGLGSLATITPTGTANGTNFLRDDGSWQTVTSGTTYTGTANEIGVSGSVISLLSAITLTGKTLTGGTFASPSLTAATTNQMTLSGNLSAPAWTTSGVRIKGVTATLTDTSSSGTVAAAYTDVLGGNTIAASNATTFTNYLTAYFKEPTAGTNVTMTNKYALGADSLRVGTSNQLTVSPAGVLTVPGGLTASLATSTGLPLTTGVTGTLPLANGGTSNTTGAASGLTTSGASVSVSAASPPSTGQVLTATGATTATWQASGSSWGGITGTLANQSDLRKSFDGAGKKAFWTYKHLRDQVQAVQPPVIRTLCLGDSWAVNPSGNLQAKFGFFGSIRGPDWCNLSGSATSGITAFYSDYDKTPWGRSIVMASTGTVIFNRYPNATGKFAPARYAVVMYEGATGSDSFTVDYETRTGSWTSLGTVLCNAVATSGFQVWTSAAFSPQAVRVRVSWASGSVRIYAGGVTSTTDNEPTAGAARQGIVDCDVSSSGSLLSSVATVPQQAWTGLVGWLKPDLVFLRERGAELPSASTWGANWQTIIDRIRVARPECDIVMTGGHPTGDGGASADDAGDAWMKAWCDTNNGLFIDVKAALPNTFLESVALGYNKSVAADGGIHLQNLGTEFVRDLQMRMLHQVCRWDTISSEGMSLQTGPRWNGSMQQNGAGVVFDGTTGSSGSFNFYDSGASTGTINYQPRFGIISNGSAGRNDDGGITLTGNSGLAIAVMQNAMWTFSSAGLNMYQRNPLARIEAHAGTSAVVPLCAGGVTGQTADLIQLRKLVSGTNYDGGAVVSAFTPTGTLRFDEVGSGVVLKAATNGRIGTGPPLTAGVATVGNTGVTTNTHVLITKTAHGGTGGTSYVVTKNPGTSFTITAVDGSGATVTTDTSTFDWVLFERQ